MRARILVNAARASRQQRLHGQNFTKFVQVAKPHDPEGKFVGDYTRRTFGL
jgi:hypothetical protein